MKLAIIGSYGHVGTVLGGIGHCEDVELVAVAKWGADDPLRFLGNHPAAPDDLPVFDDYERMLDKAKPDLVGVFCPLYLNAFASIAAAERGCHVISEKPLATTPADLAALRASIETAGVRIAALMTMRAEPAFIAIRQAVADGRIGRPVLACGQKSYPFANRDDYYRTRETYGGSIGWQAIHAIDFVSYCTGRDFTRVAAMASNVAHPTHPGMEDSGGLLFELAGGGHAVIWFDYLRPWPGDGKRPWGDDRLRIVGTAGKVETFAEGTRVRLMTPTGEEELPLPAPECLLSRFVASVRGEGEALITPAESFRMTEVTLKARDAADGGHLVDL